MTVYADISFSVNAAINYLLLLAGGMMAGCDLNRKRIFIAAAIGGFYASLILFPNLRFLGNVCIHILILFLMIWCAYGLGRQTIRMTFLFLGASFMFAGIVLLCLRLFQSGMILTPDGTFYPVRADQLLLLCAICYLAFRLLLTQSAAQSCTDIEEIEVFFEERTILLRALHDSGNTLIDPISSQPVMIADWKTADRLFPALLLKQEELGNPAELLCRVAEFYPAAKPRLIPYHAVGTPDGILLTVRCRCRQKKQEIWKFIAFSETAFSETEPYNALIGR